MGSAFAYDLASGEFVTDREQAVSIHLSSNHYPPVSSVFVAPCIEAIDLTNEGDPDARVYLPSGVSWKGYTTAPAYALIESFHLEAWLDQVDY